MNNNFKKILENNNNNNNKKLIKKYAFNNNNNNNNKNVNSFFKRNGFKLFISMIIILLVIVCGAGGGVMLMLQKQKKDKKEKEELLKKQQDELTKKQTTIDQQIGTIGTLKTDKEDLEEEITQLETDLETVKNESQNNLIDIVKKAKDTADSSFTKAKKEIDAIELEITPDDLTKFDTLKKANNKLLIDASEYLKTINEQSDIVNTLGKDLVEVRTAATEAIKAAKEVVSKSNQAINEALEFQKTELVADLGEVKGELAQKKSELSTAITDKATALAQAEEDKISRIATVRQELKTEIALSEKIKKYTYEFNDNSIHYLKYNDNNSTNGGGNIEIPNYEKEDDDTAWTLKVEKFIQEFNKIGNEYTRTKFIGANDLESIKKEFITNKKLKKEQMKKILIHIILITNPNILEGEDTDYKLKDDVKSSLLISNQTKIEVYQDDEVITTLAKVFSGIFFSVFALALILFSAYPAIKKENVENPPVFILLGVIVVSAIIAFPVYFETDRDKEKINESILSSDLMDYINSTSAIDAMKTIGQEFYYSISEDEKKIIESKVNIFFDKNLNKEYKDLLIDVGRDNLQDPSAGIKLEDRLITLLTEYRYNEKPNNIFNNKTRLTNFLQTNMLDVIYYSDDKKGTIKIFNIDKTSNNELLKYLADNLVDILKDYDKEASTTPSPQAATPSPQAATPSPQAATPSPQAATPTTEDAAEAASDATSAGGTSTDTGRKKDWLKKYSEAEQAGIVIGILIAIYCVLTLIGSIIYFIYFNRNRK